MWLSGACVHGKKVKLWLCLCTNEKKEDEKTSLLVKKGGCDGVFVGCGIVMGR